MVEPLNERPTKKLDQPRWTKKVLGKESDGSESVLKNDRLFHRKSKANDHFKHAISKVDRTQSDGGQIKPLSPQKEITDQNEDLFSFSNGPVARARPTSLRKPFST